MVRHEVLTISNGMILAIMPTFFILMGSLVLGIGMQNIQPLVKRFDMSFNPILPAINISLCVHLLSTFDSFHWFTISIWTVSGE